MGQTGRDVVAEVLATERVDRVFGNPGSTELAFIDALADVSIDYVLALQEASVVAMADGYAQATGRAAVCNLHTTSGLGNAMGNLVNARWNRTPVIVTAGQQDRRHLRWGPLLSGDLVGMAAPVCRSAEEVTRADDLGLVLRRAFSRARAEPTGPTFVSIPMDVLDEEVGVAVPPPVPVVRPAGDVADLAERLAGLSGDDVALVADDEVVRAGAVEALVAVAERLGCGVWGAPLHGTTVFPTTHPQWRGGLAPAAAGIRETFAGAQAVVYLGAPPFVVYPYTPGPVLEPHVSFVHVTADAASIGAAHPTALGVVGDLRGTLEALRGALPERVPGPAGPADPPSPSPDREAVVPLAPADAVKALGMVLPGEASVVDESTTASYHVRTHLTGADGGYFFGRAGGLGWGMPAAVGVSLGRGRAPVACVVGDGSACYSPQALWTAARERTPVLFVVLDNRQYLILKGFATQLGTRMAAEGAFVGMDVAEPAVDHAGLARSFGVEARVASTAGDLADAAETAWARGVPALVEVPVTTG